MCDCLETLNKYLEKHNNPLINNTKISTMFSIALGEKIFSEHIIIETERIDKKNINSSIVIQPSFCPFCGEKYV